MTQEQAQLGGSPGLLWGLHLLWPRGPGAGEGVAEARGLVVLKTPSSQGSLSRLAALAHLTTRGWGSSIPGGFSGALG